MKHWTLSASTAVILLFQAGAAFSITPEEVWESWKAQTVGTGVTLTVESEDRNGSSVEIKGLRSTFADGSGGQLITEVDSLVLSDRGDGTVEVKTSETWPLYWVEPGEPADKPKVEMKISQPGAVVIASGTAEATKYDFTLPKLQLELVRSLDAQGQPETVQLSATVADLAGDYLVSARPDGGFGLESTIRSGAIALRGSGTENDERFNVVFDLAGISGKSSGVFIDPALMSDMAQAIAAGFEVASTSEAGAMSFAVELEKEGEISTLSGKMEAGRFHTNINKERLDYGLSLLAGEFAGTLPETGIASGDVSFSEIAFGFDLPVGVSETASDFAALVRLAELKFSDEIWQSFDPAGQLGRDPITAVLDLTGKGAWLTDIFAGQSLDDLTETPELPMRLEALNLAQLLLKLTGAEVKANGALTFDNSDTVTFGGIPAPSGTITVNLSGISALLDKLVAFGVIDASDLTGVRMGLAMFTRPGAGPDQLISEIEFRNKGLFVNGQQIM